MFALSVALKTFKFSVIRFRMAGKSSEKVADKKSFLYPNEMFQKYLNTRHPLIHFKCSFKHPALSHVRSSFMYVPCPFLFYLFGVWTCVPGNHDHSVYPIRTRNWNENATHILIGTNVLFFGFTQYRPS